jgi:hypothetical protein
MTSFKTIGLLLSLLLGTVPVAAAINVMDFGAKGDAKTDDTGAIQSALDAAGVKGKTVFVPAGQYHIDGALDIPPGVTLQGEWQAPHHAGIGKGTQFFVTGHRGDENGPPVIMLHESSCVQGITFFYPEQTIEDPKPYPWTIRGEGMHGSVINVTLVGAWQGIDFGTLPNELHYISNVFGQPLKTGIFVDQTTDIGRIENVHFNPHSWARADYPTAPKGQAWKKLKDFLAENFTGFLFGRTDWEYVHDCFCIFPKVGFLFTEFERGPGNVLISRSGADMGPVAVLVENSQPHAGLSFSNCQMFGDIIIGPDNPGPVKFDATGFFGSIHGTNGTAHAKVSGSGPVSFNNCHFNAIDPNCISNRVIVIAGAPVSIQGCSLLDTGFEHVVIEPESPPAIITGNRFMGPAKIIYEQGEGHVIANNVEQQPREEPGSVVIDDSYSEPAFSTEGEWFTGVGGEDYMGKTHWAYAGEGEARAYWKPDLPQAGKYEVFVWYGQDPTGSHATGAPYIVHHSEGTTKVPVDLTANMGQWNSLGVFTFDAGQSGYVEATNETGLNVNADAVKFVKVD